MRKQKRIELIIKHDPITFCLQETHFKCNAMSRFPTNTNIRKSRLKASRITRDKGIEVCPVIVNKMRMVCVTSV